MSWLIYLRQSIKNLLRNPFRSFLALLGISIGIACVVTIYSIGEWFNESIKAEFSALGADTVLILPISIETDGGNVSNVEWMRIRLNYIEDLKKEFDEIEYIIPSISDWGDVSHGKLSIKSSFIGTTPEFMLIGEKKMERGVFWSDMDLYRGNNVCVLGSVTAERLFSSQEAVGKKILIRGVPFNVLGVLLKSPSGGFSMGNMDSSVIMPYTTLQKKLAGRKYSNINEARVVPVKGADINALIPEIKKSLIKRLRIKKDEDVKFTVETSEAFSDMVSSIIGEWIKFLIVAAGISLLIGGLGIMNIMLVSVTERTREIGIRMSLGATGKDIIKQFLIESVILCFIGGVIGIMLSYPFAVMASKFMDYSTKISVGIMFIAFLYSCGIGIFFGLYPAYSASKMDPVESLRYE